MNVLVIGSGAREHALVRALHRSPQQPLIFCCGSSLNPGIDALTQAFWTGDIADVAKVVEIAQGWQIQLAIIGPEAPLEKGLADQLGRHGIPTVGPKKQLAQIETSKGFARDLLQKYHIPGLPHYRIFSDLNGVEDFLHTLGEGHYVIKANGLMGGKGVKVAGDHLHSITEALAFCTEIHQSGQTFVIEEKLIGEEFSLLAFCDGKQCVSMPLVQDHKRAYVGDKGPNTGGMGSYSDANHRLPFLTESDIRGAEHINTAVMQALHTECGEKYQGILYGSFIATRNGIAVIEFNARFGDPEALNVLSILDSDFLAICQALVQGQLTPDKVRFAPLATVCKYAVPEGYPDQPVKHFPIDIHAVAQPERLYLGAVDMQEGVLYATGSRTAAVVGIADTIAAAEQIAEAEIQQVRGALFHREDIGTDSLLQQRIKHMKNLRLF